MRAIADQMPEVVKRPPASWRQKLTCLVGDHDWCARTDLGANPVKVIEKTVQLGKTESFIREFFRFAAPVCRYCPKQLPPRDPYDEQ